MARSSSSRQKRRSSDDYVVQRAAEYLHGGVDRLVEQGERLEQRLHDGYERIDAEAHRLNSNVQTSVGQHPWMTIGGSVAVGFLVGMLSARRF